MLQDAPEFWISREDYLEEGVACLSKCGPAWLLTTVCNSCWMFSVFTLWLHAFISQENTHKAVQGKLSHVGWLGYIISYHLFASRTKQPAEWFPLLLLLSEREKKKKRLPCRSYIYTFTRPQILVLMCTLIEIMLMMFELYSIVPSYLKINQLVNIHP